MAVTNPKYIIKNIIDTYITGTPITKDDNITNATVISLYEGGSEDLVNLFLDDDFDVVITLGEPQVRSMRDIVDVPEHYPERIAGTVTTTDKFDLLGNRVCTASKMQYKTKVAMRAAIEGSVHSAAGVPPVYTIKILEERGEHRKIGGTRFWITPYYIEYKDA